MTLWLWCAACLRCCVLAVYIYWFSLFPRHTGTCMAFLSLGTFLHSLNQDIIFFPKNISSVIAIKEWLEITCWLCDASHTMRCDQSRLCNGIKYCWDLISFSTSVFVWRLFEKMIVILFLLPPTLVDCFIFGPPPLIDDKSRSVGFNLTGAAGLDTTDVLVKCWLLALFRFARVQWVADWYLWADC